jgi:hypothetical protein
MPARASLKALGIEPGVPLRTRDQVRHAKLDLGIPCNEAETKSLAPFAGANAGNLLPTSLPICAPSCRALSPPG